MSTADGSEASIEDILASIRQTFADDPKPAAAPAAESRLGTMPSFRSVADAAPSSGTPLPTPPRSRAAAIDDDLADLIDAPPTRAPAPSISSAPSPAPAAPQLPVSPIEAAREKWASLLNPGTATNGAMPKPAEPAAAKLETPAPPIGEAAAAPAVPAPAAPPAGLSGLFAPRKGGFIPASETRSDPVLPMPPSAAEPPAPAKAAEPPAPAPGPAPAPVTAQAPAAAPAPSPPRSGFIPFWQPVSPQSDQPAAAAAGPLPVATAPPPARQQKSPEPGPLPEVTAASSRMLDDLVAELNSAAPPAPEVPPAPQAQPAQPPAAAPPAAPAAANVESMAAVALAAVASKKVAAPVAPTPAAAAPPAETAPPSSSNRSFEDVVADMLRPLLEKWIDENMPRIVERALQRDATLGRKSSS